MIYVISLWSSNKQIQNYIAKCIKLKKYIIVSFLTSLQVMNTCTLVSESDVNSATDQADSGRKIHRNDSTRGLCLF